MAPNSQPSKATNILEAGCLVVIERLVQKPQLNGRLAVVVSVQPSGRYVGEPCSSMNKFSLKGSNCNFIPNEQGSDGLLAYGVCHKCKNMFGGEYLKCCSTCKQMQKRYDEAIHLCREVVQFPIDALPGNAQGIASAYGQLGNLLWTVKNDKKGALDAFAAGLLIEPNHSFIKAHRRQFLNSEQS